MNRIRFAVATVAVLAAGGFVVFRSGQPPALESVVAEKKDVTATLAVSGILESVNRSTVASQLAGVRVSRVLVDLGDAVEEGQLMLEFDDADFRAQRDAANAQINQADAQASLQDSNRSNADRQLALATRALNDATELRLALTNAQTAQRTAAERVKQAEANLARIRSAGRAEQVRQLKAQVDRAITLRDQRKRELDRSRALHAEGAIATSALELAQTAFETAEKDVEIAREGVALAEKSRIEDIRQAESQVVEARAAASGATQAVALAQRNLAERTAARQQVISAETQRDAAVASRRISEATRSQAEAARAAAEANLSKTQVRAPFSGRVSQRLIEPGQTAALGAPLFILANPDALRVRLDVDEQSLNLLRVGERAKVSFDAYPDLQLDATVSEIGSAADFQRGTVEVRLTLDKTDPRLKPELTADANIIVANYRQAVVIPRRAVLNPTDNPEVYVVKNGVTEARKIKWARGNEDNVVVTEGLEAGERILLTPRSTRPGARVNAVPARPAGGR